MSRFTVSMFVALFLIACAGQRVTLRLNGERTTLTTDQLKPMKGAAHKEGKSSYRVFLVQDAGEDATNLTVRCRLKRDCAAATSDADSCVDWRTCRQHKEASRKARHKAFDQMGNGINGAPSETETDDFLDRSTDQEDTPAGEQ